MLTPAFKDTAASLASMSSSDVIPLDDNEVAGLSPFTEDARDKG